MGNDAADRWAAARAEAAAWVETVKAGEILSYDQVEAFGEQAMDEIRKGLKARGMRLNDYGGGHEVEAECPFCTRSTPDPEAYEWRKMNHDPDRDGPEVRHVWVCTACAEQEDAPCVNCGELFDEGDGYGLCKGCAEFDEDEDDDEEEESALDATLTALAEMAEDPATRTFRLTIDLGNAAFSDDPYELSRILRDVAGDVQSGMAAGNTGQVRDVNGNRVGSWSIE